MIIIRVVAMTIAIIHIYLAGRCMRDPDLVPHLIPVEVGVQSSVLQQMKLWLKHMI